MDDRKRGEIGDAPDRERLIAGEVLSARERQITLANVHSALRELAVQVKTIDALGRELAQQLRIASQVGFQELGTLAQVAGRIAQTPAIPLSWWDPPRRAELVSAVARAAEDERVAQAQRPSLVAKLAPLALAAESSPLAREAGEASQAFWRWLPWSRWNRLHQSLSVWYPAGMPDNASLRADMQELAAYHRRMDSAWQVATAYAAELLGLRQGKVDWAANVAGLADIEKLAKWGAKPELKTLLGPGGGFDRTKLNSAMEQLEKALKTFDLAWTTLLKELAVPGSDVLISKPVGEFLGWLEAEAASVEKEGRTLGRVIDLLAAGKDLPASALRDRSSRLRQLVGLRAQIVAASSSLGDARSPRELAAINHAQIAGFARLLLGVLCELPQPLTAGIIAALTDRVAREKLGEIVKDSAMVAQAFNKSWQRVTAELFDPDTLVSTNVILNKTGLVDLKSWAADRIADIDRLSEWTSFLQIERDAASFGVGGIIEEVKSGEYAPAFAADAFRARFYRLWLDALHQQIPVLGGFATASHERLISRFAELDRLAIRTTPARI